MAANNFQINCQIVSGYCHYECKTFFISAEKSDQNIVCCIHLMGNQADATISNKGPDQNIVFRIHPREKESGRENEQYSSRSKHSVLYTSHKK